MAKKTETKVESIEREYIIPLRKRYQHVARYKKTNKAVKTIKEFLVRHMKIRDRDLSKIKIDNYLNEVLWSRGIKNPPHKIKIKAIKKGDIIRVESIELPDKLRFKKARAEKREKAALDAKKKKKSAKASEEIAKKPEETKTEEEKKEEAEKKETEKEKAAAGAEATKQLEKAAAKQIKQQKTPKVRQPKRQVRKALAK